MKRRHIDIKINNEKNLHFLLVTLNTSLNLLINDIQGEEFCHFKCLVLSLLSVFLVFLLFLFKKIVCMALPFFYCQKKFLDREQRTNGMNKRVTAARTVHLSKTIKCNKIIFHYFYRGTQNTKNNNKIRSKTNNLSTQLSSAQLRQVRYKKNLDPRFFCCQI